MVLTIASLIMKTIGIVYNVYLTNLIGTEAVGLFGLIMTVYMLGITFASSGIRLAVIRLISNSTAKALYAEKKIISCSLLFGFIMGAVSAVILFFTSNFISLVWLCDNRATKSLQILSFSLPFIAMSSALNGYFTARRKVTKYSAIQIIEQLAKIGITVLLLTLLAKKGTEFACIAISLGSIISEVVSFLWAYILYIIDKRKLTFAFSKTKDIFFSFFKIAIPDAVGSWARYSLTTAEHILIPMGLRKSGQNASASLSLYGMVQGMALPIILFPSSLMVSLSSMLIPEVAEHHARGSARQIDYIISRVISISLLFSIGTMGVMYNYSYELANAIYKTADIADYIKILSAVIPVMYTDIVVDSFLKGLDKQVDSMRYNILDAFLCVLLVYFLIPKFAIKGYIITIFASEIINFVLSLRKLISITSFKINLLDSLVKPIFCILSAVAITNLITLNITLSPVLELCFKVLICLILYILTLSLFGAITKEDKVWFYNLLKN